MRTACIHRSLSRMRTCCVGEPVRRENANGEGYALAGVLFAIKVEAGAVGVLCGRQRGEVRCLHQVPVPFLPAI